MKAINRVTQAKSLPTKGWMFLAASLLSCAGSSPALAQYYIGPSYLNIPGTDGGTPNHAPYKGWVRTEAHYWTKKPPTQQIRGISGKESGLKFTGSTAPAKGPNLLSVSIDKQNPALASMMEKCRSGAVIPQITYAESSEMARHNQEHGPRPANIPDYYEYALKNVRLTCPVVANAPEQAFQLKFDDIEWLNAQPQPKPVEITTAKPAKLMRAPKSGASRVFLVSWFAPIADSREDQCDKMNPKPSQDDYYALMEPQHAAEMRKNLADKGGANPMIMPYRGPDEMNVILLPGIVPDTGFLAPKADVVRGFNLDNDDGSGPAPSNTRQHKNFVSPDGRRGIDNQLFTVQGCIAGWRRNGFLPMIGNELRRAGGLSILIEVAGIDNEQNDDNVAVTLLYSADPMRRDGTSKIVLPDYTFRVNDSPEFSQDFARFRGKIVNGVLMTEPLKKIYLHEGSVSTWSLADARMRIEFKPDGTMTGELGGYRDWREYLSSAFFQWSNYENTIGFQAPAMYNAVRRAADGLKDKETGEFTGISAAYEIEGIPAFLPSAEKSGAAQHIARSQ